MAPVQDFCNLENPLLMQNFCSLENTFPGGNYSVYFITVSVPTSTFLITLSGSDFLRSVFPTCCEFGVNLGQGTWLEICE